MTKDNKDIRDSKENYKFILKKGNYRDISFLGVLKHLYKVHKINKYQYKESIRRIINNKPLKNNVYFQVHYYLSTLKSSSSKNTLLALNRKDNKKQYCRFVKIEYQNQQYAVTIKKEKYKEIMFNKFLSNEYKDLMIKAIIKEFNKLMGGLQKDIIIYWA